MKHRSWRILSLALIVFLYSFCACFSVNAQAWNGSIASSFASGSGAKNDPYVIETADQLAYLADSTSGSNTYNGVYFVLKNDIALGDESFVFDSDTGLVRVSDGENTAYLGTGIKGDGSKSNTVFDTQASEVGVWYASDTSRTKGSYAGTLNIWTPIGGLSTRFEGNFDGQGHVISGIYINTPLDFGGLFGHAYGTLKNIKISNSYIRAGEYTGSIAGYNSYRTEGCVADAVVCSDKSYVGGVVGNGSTVTDSISECAVRGARFVGGIAGKAKVERCCSTGSVFGDINVGGIAGEGKGRDNQSSANVLGAESVGGICGVLGQNMSDPQIATSYSTGTVNGEKYVGSVVGRLVNGSAENCYYLKGTAVDSSNKVQNGLGSASIGLSPSDAVGATTGLDRSQIKLKESFVGFDFENVWTVSSSGTPMLASFEVEIHNHVYDNSCDETCNSCGETRVAEHSYKSRWSADAGAHWHECSGCSQRKDHESHKAGASATENSPQLCTVCSYVIAPAQGHTHKFSNARTKDSTGHWYACACGEKQDYSSHLYDNACDSVCDDCAWVRITTHSYNDVLSKDDTNHWYECACGDRRDIEKHKYDNGCDTDCSVCGYERTAKHTYGEIKKYDDKSHWQECVLCKIHSEASQHLWDSGTVIKEPTENEDGIKTYKCTECSYTKNEPIDRLPSVTTNAVTTDTPVSTTNTTNTTQATDPATTTQPPQTSPITQHPDTAKPLADDADGDSYLVLAIVLGIISVILLAALIVMLLCVLKKKDK